MSWMKPGQLVYWSTGEESHGIVVGPSPKGDDYLALRPPLHPNHLLRRVRQTQKYVQ
eukprot:CAMPEP_0174331228 /NCGR_PEP_ID=MMETSP0810-20121108/17326_1 /TAXON_ID=73025 ORGANISM="Eutreptiella gymnastica-like, Strain CCMP1594" /NCGR_SAMPLE_ID=MMETSP0810 /ASSEMBLY_ACC=CAM_ASM_000659 /LENGTH=56 /DNA_ID=CAMNT_0015446903 /DNA_START=119 /DNA_END=289 /DNA_ORIENTATION=-